MKGLVINGNIYTIGFMSSGSLSISDCLALNGGFFYIENNADVTTDYLTIVKTFGGNSHLVFALTGS